MNSNSITRIRYVLIFLSFFAFIIILRLYYLQIAHGREFTEKANKQYVKQNSIVFDRGSIFFSSKLGERVGAAILKDNYTLSITPKNIKDSENVYKALSQYVDIDKDSFIWKAQKKEDPYEELKKKIDESLAQSIEALKIPGVNIQKESWRIYPAGALASHSIGLIGYDENNHIAGRYGLERYYEDVLVRKSNSSSVNFFAELFAGVRNSVFNDRKKEGDVITSIEPTVSSYLEKTLSETQEKWKSDSIGGIIMDPKTGAIVAMSSLPSFNPNDLSEVKDPKIFSNPLVENVYEMGSIIKPLTMASGIDSETITPQSTYNDEGFLMLSGKKISNYDGRARGVIPMQEILSQSLNVGASYISLKMGADAFSKYFTNFGFGQLTGIDQPNEQKGIIKNLLTKRDVEIATASYGQGIAMTPMETIRALTAIANGGLLVRPHLASFVEYSDHTTYSNTFENSQRVLRTKTTEDVTNMLVKVVDYSLKKGQAKMEHYSIAAKTGTAQIADPVNGGYYSDRYLHSFFGYFPAYNPKFIVFLYHIYPKGAEFASETLTDPFMQLSKFLINYYEIPPDR